MIKNDDGTSADISDFTNARMTVRKMDDTILFTIDESDHLTITSPNVVWDMQPEETGALQYDGKIKIQIELTKSPDRKRLVKTFYGFIYKNIMP